MWKTVQNEFPTMAIMARDILAIPASKARVERLFNKGRDICHYRRNQLSGQTIEDAMIVKLWEKQHMTTSQNPKPAQSIMGESNTEVTEDSMLLILDDLVLIGSQNSEDSTILELDDDKDVTLYTEPFVLNQDELSDLIDEADDADGMYHHVEMEKPIDNNDGEDVV